MRLIQVLIPTGTRQAVLETLDEQGIDYAVFDEVSRGISRRLSTSPSAARCEACVIGELCVDDSWLGSL